MSRPIEHEEGRAGGRGEQAWRWGVRGTDELGGDLRNAGKPGGCALDLRRARAVRSGAASAADRLKEAKWATMRDWASRSRPRKLARSRRPSRSGSPRTPFT